MAKKQNTPDGAASGSGWSNSYDSSYNDGTIIGADYGIDNGAQYAGASGGDTYVSDPELKFARMDVVPDAKKPDWRPNNSSATGPKGISQSGSFKAGDSLLDLI